jgi:hypothetical protein
LSPSWAHDRNDPDAAVSVERQARRSSSCLSDRGLQRWQRDTRYSGRAYGPTPMCQLAAYEPTSRASTPPRSSTQSTPDGRR